MAGTGTGGTERGRPLPLLRSGRRFRRRDCLVQREAISREDADHTSRPERPRDSADFVLLERAAGNPNRHRTGEKLDRYLPRCKNTSDSGGAAIRISQNIAAEACGPLARPERTSLMDEQCAG